MNTRSLVARPVCILSVVLAAAPAAWADNIVNGDFVAQFFPWKATHETSAVGIVASDRFFAIGNGAVFGGDTNVASIYQNLYAEGQPKKAGILDSRMILYQDVADIPGTTLSLEWGTAFNITLWTNGLASYTKSVIVENFATGAYFEQPLVHSPRVQIPRMCPLPIYIDGAAFYQPACLDLSAAGFNPGDDVRVSFVSHIRVQADEDCDAAAFQSTFFMDEVTFTDCSPEPLTRDDSRVTPQSAGDGIMTISSTDIRDPAAATPPSPGVAEPGLKATPVTIRP